MQQYLCDWCGRQRRDRESWIVALAAEHLGVTSCRREISIAAHWSEELARHPFAVHFCSEVHKQKYIERLLFHQDEVVVTTRGRAGTTPARTAQSRRSAASAGSRSRAPRFNRADRLRARGLGIQI